mmetsp:Transcript_13846/g.18186  ORF Transcript_13846/g.18186 Transcript_13846/m.18186 type:complete len:98 (+) Transcript_13846:85-378(+)
MMQCNIHIWNLRNCSAQCWEHLGNEDDSWNASMKTDAGVQNTKISKMPQYQRKIRRQRRDHGHLRVKVPFLLFRSPAFIKYVIIFNAAIEYHASLSC